MRQKRSRGVWAFFSGLGMRWYASCMAGTGWTSSIGHDIPVPGTVRVEDDPAFGLGEHRAGADCRRAAVGSTGGAFFPHVFQEPAPARAENQKWVNWWWRVRSSSSGARARHADKEHKYFTCKQCKTICRVPVGKGKIIITCPKCGAQIHAKS